MAIKTFDQIVSIIKAGKPKWVEDAVKEHFRLNVHINGKNTASYLKMIDSIENPNQLKLRQDFLTTNRHIFASLSRPVDKVFSAKGGGSIYNLNTEAKEKKLSEKLNNVRHGKNIRSWIKDIQANKYYTDPCGLVFFEWNLTDTYPTVKSIKSIHKYKSEGRTLEWVLFEPIEDLENDQIIYRFVDDKFDYTICKKDNEFYILEDQTYSNPFKKVPAIINSDIINSDLTHNESPFEVAISLADHYLRTGTIKNINEFLHGYPIFWRYATDCKVCKGLGSINGEVCTSCSGTGKNLSKDITDIIQIEIPTSDDPVLAPNLAGYVSPPVEGIQEMRTEQENLLSLMELTIWGSKMAKDVTNETATAAFLNVQPVNERLNAFSDSFEDLEKKMVDLIGLFYLKNYSGSSINYGRRYLTESPEVIWNKYEKARKEGSSKVALDYLLLQFYQSEYHNDIERLAIMQKSIKLEPFVHKTDEEVIKLPLLSKDIKAKLYFNEWFKTIPIVDLLTKDISVLQQEYETYLNTKQNDTNVQGIQSIA